MQTDFYQTLSLLGRHWPNRTREHSAVCANEGFSVESDWLDDRKGSNGCRCQFDFFHDGRQANWKNEGSASNGQEAFKAKRSIAVIEIQARSSGKSKQ